MKYYFLLLFSVIFLFTSIDAQAQAQFQPLPSATLTLTPIPPNSTSYMASMSYGGTPINTGTYSATSVSEAVRVSGITPSIVQINGADTGIRVIHNAEDSQKFGQALQAAQQRIDPGSESARSGVNPGVMPKNNSSGVGSKIMNFFIWLISFSFYFVSMVVGLLIYISGLMIDFFFSADQLASSKIVQVGWTFTRDTLNFIFILVLLAISFSTIAGLETFQMKKALPSVIFAALLVNFSLAIGGAFLQVSNVMTESIAGSLLGSESGGKGKVGEKLTNGLVKSGDIGQFYTYTDVDWIKGLKMKTLLPAKGKVDLEQALTLNFDQYLQMTVNSAIALVMICIFAAAFIFLAALMAVRLVMLVILLILAPVPFVFSLIPKTKSYADMWWDNFIKYVIFLPVVTFFLALAIQLLSAKPAGSTTPMVNQFFSDANKPEGITAGVLGSMFDMVFVTIFIFASVLVAKKLGIAGADRALSAAKGITKSAAKVGMMPTKLVAKGATAGGSTLANKTGLSALTMPAINAGISGARRAGGQVRNLYSGGNTGAIDRVSEQQKSFSGKSEADVRAAMEGGNAGAAAEMLERGDLKTDADFAKAKKLIPKNSKLGGKLADAHSAKMPVSGVTGISSSRISSEVSSAGGVSAETQKAITGNVKDTRSYASKMKPEDITKNQDQIRALLQTARQQIATGGVTDASKLAINLTPDKIKAYSQHLDSGGQKDLEDLLKQMHNGGTNSLLNKAQQLAATKNAYTI